MNYQLSAAIQQMGCGPADIITLCGFMGLPGKSIRYHIKEVEHTLGKIQISTKEKSEEDAVKEEILAHEEHEHDGLTTYECTVRGHEHPPLPKLKGSYGKKIII